MPRPPKRTPEPDLSRVSRRQVAAVLGMSEALVHHRIRDGVFQEQAGRLDLVACAAAERERRAGEGRGTKSAAELRIREEQARRLQLANDARAGVLMERDEVDAIVSTCLAAVARMCDALGPVVAGVVNEGLSPAQARARVDDEVRAIRESAAVELEREIGPAPGSGSAAADPGSDAGPVGGRTPARRSRQRRGRKPVPK